MACDVVGLSIYAWNAKTSLEIARRLKQERSDVTLVFGGPHVPNDSETFLRAHSFIDYAIHGEGERPFLALLEQLPGGDGRSVSGCSFIGADGTYIKTNRAARILELESIPSPFLTGIFDRLMDEGPTQEWIGLWETNRGCPFACTFCDWGSATASKVTQFSLDRLKRELEWFSTKNVPYVYCCDANFGILKRDEEIAEYAATLKKKTGFPRALSVQNTKNAVERAYKAQKILSDSGLSRGVTLSMQSLNQLTLSNIRRSNISLDAFNDLQRRFTRDGIDTYSDLILGLPGETYDTFVDGTCRLIANGQHNRIRFNNLSILPNAEMSEAGYRAKYGLQTVESTLIALPGQKTAGDDVDEVQELVVATSTMPSLAWRRARVFAWLTTLLYFDRLLQIPLVLTRQEFGIGLRAVIEGAIENRQRFPVLGKVVGFFEEQAASIQQGGVEYPYSSEWLGMYWPTDEYAFIGIVVRNEIDGLYADAGNLLAMLMDSSTSAPVSAVDEAFRLNRALLKLPRETEDITIEGDFNILELYQNTLRGKPCRLVRRQGATTVYRRENAAMTFQAWIRDVVWAGKQSGSYFNRSEIRWRDAGEHAA
jgi:tRNA A37 methylthiotransferase MiaB